MVTITLNISSDMSVRNKLCLGFSKLVTGLINYWHKRINNNPEDELYLNCVIQYLNLVDHVIPFLKVIDEYYQPLWS